MKARSGMRRGSAKGGAVALLLGVATAAFAADHREAPTIEEDASADIADIYAFLNPNDNSRLVLAMTVNGFAVGAEASSYNFSPLARYRFQIDNTGDARAEHTIELTFGPVVPGPQILRATFPGGIVVQGEVTEPVIVLPGEEPPSPVINQDAAGTVRVFAGPRDDPFFFDFAPLSRYLQSCREGACNGELFAGVDAFAGFNVSAIVVDLPVTMVADGSEDLQIWGITERQALTFRRNDFDGGVAGFGAFTQIERMGNPVVNTVVIPLGLKDAFNLGRPDGDATAFAPIIVDSLVALGTDETNIGILGSVAVPDTLKLNLAQTSGFPNGRRLQDDVIDTYIFFVTNQSAQTGDGVDANDKAFLSDFPFLAPPHPAPSATP